MTRLVSRPSRADRCPGAELGTLPRLFAFCCIVGLPAVAMAASPTLQSVSIQGLRIGQTTTLTLVGTDLPTDPQLILPFQIAQQRLEGVATTDRLTIAVTLADDVPFGIYPLRVAGRGGISNPIMIGVDRLPQRLLGDEAVTLPVALSSTVSGAEIRRVRFQGKAKSRLVCDLECRRLGSSLRPVLRLFDSRGKQLAWSPGLRQIGGDARLQVQLPDDGEYQVEVHDVLYRAPGGSAIRLKLGDLPFADHTFPLAVTGLGATEGTQPSRVALLGGGLPDSLQVPIDASNWPAAGLYPLGYAPAELATGGQPAVILSPNVEMVEDLTQAPMQLPAAPVGVSGTLDKAGEQDQYRLAVRPATRLRFVVQAEGLGANLDGVLTITDPAGGQLARGDDQPTTLDPSVDLTVPANLDHVLVTVSDLQQRGGEGFYYRLLVEELGRPDYTLSIDSDRIIVPAQGTQAVTIKVTRSGYDGPIELSVPGLPSGLSLAGQTIPAGGELGLLTLSAAADLRYAAVGALLGRATAANDSLTRYAVAPVTPASEHQAWLRRDVAVAVTDPAALRVEWITGDAQQPLWQGIPRPTMVRVARNEGLNGAVRLRLLTDQVMPKKKITKDNKEEQVDDPDRALRLAAESILAADASELTLPLLVPSDLPRRNWSVVLVAELLGGDPSQVLATAVTPVQVLACQSPLAIELTGDIAPTGANVAAGIRAKGIAGVGPHDQLNGRIVRLAPFAGPVEVTLAGLPDGYSHPRVLVPEGQDAFSLPLQFAFGNKPGSLSGVRVVALGRPLSPPAAAARSNEVAVELEIIAGEKPTAEPAREVFEDDSRFIEQLTDGGGQAHLETDDKHSGKVSLKVTLDQKFNAQLPGLNVPIRENPGPGEYRYLRFAWKKKGGNSICLQLNHDGYWGRGGSGKPDAKFRYHAGPGGECLGASLAVAPQLPGDFEVVTRDLYADFGEFTLMGLGFAPVDGEHALFDHIYLGRTPDDFALTQP